MTKLMAGIAIAMVALMGTAQVASADALDDIKKAGKIRIAVDLGVSPGTVKTYRNRAFDRLGIHHRNELFALVAGIG